MTDPLKQAVRRHAPWLSLLLLPLLAIWPVYLGMSPNPIYLTSGLLSQGAPGWLPGLTNLDLNVGATTQALGHLAAEQWLAGQVPWWNPYNGIGMPLAGEMQGSALFLPFVLLLHFPFGPLLIKLVLQMVAGLATYRLLRRLALDRSSAWIGGVLFGLNGTFALLGHGPIMPVAFLPLFLLGIENARTGGYRLIAAAVALSIYAGFPETAFIDGLLALAWAIWRLATDRARLRTAGWIALGGTLGLAIAAPAIWSFFHMLANGTAEYHTSGFMAATSDTTPPPNHPMPLATTTMWLFPYLMGPLQAFLPLDTTGIFPEVVANQGGYLGVGPLFLALLSVGGRQYRALRMVLAAWIVVLVARSIGLPWVTEAVNLIPWMRETIISRYGIVSWQFAATILAVLALDDHRRGLLTGRRIGLALAGTLLCVAVTLGVAMPLVRAIAAADRRFMVWPALSVAWAAGVGLCLLLAVRRGCTPARLGLCLAVLLIDAAAMYSLPLLSGVRGGRLDDAAIAFLQDHAGLQRFYSLGVYRPNYGAYFKTAQIDHEYLPLPGNWVDHVIARLDPSASRGAFRGDEPPLPPGEPSHADQMLAHLDNYKALGVRYIVTPPGADPFRPGFDSQSAADHAIAHALMPGEALSGRVPADRIRAGLVESLGVDIATYLGQADGSLTAQVCVAAACATGTLPLAGAADNARATVPLSPPLALQTGDTLTWRLAHDGGSKAVAIWLPAGPQPAPLLHVGLRPAQAPPPLAHRGQAVDIYELPDAAPYFEALGGPCRLDIRSRTSLGATCEAPARLVRRELFFSGWRADIDGASAEIQPFGEVMQQIALPAGTTRIRFDYAPPFVGLCWLAAALGGLGLLPFRRRLLFAGPVRSA